MQRHEPAEVLPHDEENPPQPEAPAAQEDTNDNSLLLPQFSPFADQARGFSSRRSAALSSAQGFIILEHYSQQSQHKEHCQQCICRPGISASERQHAQHETCAAEMAGAGGGQSRELFQAAHGPRSAGHDTRNPGTLHGRTWVLPVKRECSISLILPVLPAVRAAPACPTSGTVPNLVFCFK